MSENHRKIIEYKISSGVFFEKVFKFKCLECGSRLKADVTNAGRNDFCPICKAKFITPGEENVFEDPFFKDRICKHGKPFNDSLFNAFLESDIPHHLEEDTLLEAASVDDALSPKNEGSLFAGAAKIEKRYKAPKSSSVPAATYLNTSSSEKTSTERSNQKQKSRKFLITGVDGSNGKTKIFAINAESEQSAHEAAKKLNVFPTNIVIITETAEKSTRAANPQNQHTPKPDASLLRNPKKELSIQDQMKKDELQLYCGALVLLILFAVMVLVIFGDEASNTYSPARGSKESTNEKLRRVYDSQGIGYDDRMIRDDVRVIEELHKSFGR